MTGTSLASVLLLLWPFPVSVTSEIWLQGYHFHFPCKLWSSMPCGCHGNWLQVSSLPPISQLFQVFKYERLCHVLLLSLPFTLTKDRRQQAPGLFSVSDPPGNMQCWFSRHAEFVRVWNHLDCLWRWWQPFLSLWFTYECLCEGC